MSSKPKSVLMISTKLDPHVDAVLERLQKRDVPCFRLNTDNFHAEYRVAMTDEVTGAIRIEDIWGRSCVFPHEVRSVWMRKPEPPLPPPGVDDEGIINYVGDEMREFMGFLPMDGRVPWINNPDDNRRHQRKFPQLRLARSLGLRVPRSIITNDADRAEAFFKTCPQGVICKPLLMGSHYVEGQHRVAYTRPVPPSEFLALKDTISLCPTYLQEAIAKDHELRVTIIGDELFCCRIDSQGVAGAEQDWRAVDTIDLPHTIVDLPEKVDRALRDYLKACGLRFGAFDLIVTPEGDYVFLELNPNGQWYWIELATGAPMADAMSRLLENP
jgi:glutathione synthase/RimK-type ligase-like ATP-grasp enzyme